MASCSNCGRENPAEMRFCTNCGATLPESSSSGTGSSPGSKSVETLIMSSPPETSPTNWPTIGRSYNTPAAPEPPKSRTGLIVGVVVAVLLIVIVAAGGVGYYFYSKSNDKSDNGNSNEGVRTSKVDGENENKNDNKKSSPTPTPTPANTQLFTPPTEPTKDASFTVYANGDWQLSPIAVVPLEKFTTSVEGIVDLAGAKAGIRAGGTNDAQFKSRRLFQEWPTGALLMRTRYADGRFGNTVATSAGRSNGSWVNLPDERGMIEFRINDSQQKDNGGQFTIHVKFTSAPKNKN